MKLHEDKFAFLNIINRVKSIAQTGYIIKNASDSV